jgi:tRNA A37 threonylcarbamoyltransferase TsaD
MTTLVKLSTKLRGIYKLNGMELKNENMTLLLRLAEPVRRAHKFNTGPALENVAKRGNPLAFNFPEPYKNSPSGEKFAFSFSGLKSSIRRHIEEYRGSVSPSELENFIANTAASAQHVITKHLLTRLKNCIKYCESEKLGIQDIVIGGGVCHI